MVAREDAKMDFDWFLDEDCDEMNDEVFGEGEDIEEKLDLYPKTKDGMFAMWRYLKNETTNPFEGWKYLWRESYFMDYDFRLLVAVRILTTFEQKLVHFAMPDLIRWINDLHPEMLLAVNNTEDEAEKTRVIDIISKEVRSGVLARNIKFLTDRDVLPLALAVDKCVERFPYRENNLIAVLWQKATFCDQSTIEYAPCVDYIRKDALLRDFNTIPSYESIVLSELSEMEYEGVIVLALHKNIPPACIGPDTLLTTLLNAEVPECIYNNGECGSAAKWFLKDMLHRIVHREKKKDFTDVSDEELTEEEMKRLIREVFVHNKISYYKALSAVYRELTNVET